MKFNFPLASRPVCGIVPVMRSTALLVLSGAINVALLLLLLQQGHHAASVPPTTNKFSLVRTQQMRMPMRLQRTNMSLNVQLLSWKQIEADDYVQYIANLRSIGCPEETIRDIIIADVDHVYARKRAQLALLRQDQWWQSSLDTKAEERMNQQFEALHQEKSALLAKLLGPDWEQGSDQDIVNKALAKPYLSGAVLAQLPANVVSAVREGFEKLQADYLAHLKERDKAGREEDPLAVAKMRREYRAQLEKLLTPEQLEEYLLRNSRISEQLRDQLHGLNVTPEEFRAIFRARDGVERQLLFGGYTSAEGMVRVADQMDDQAAVAIKQVIGLQRFQEFQQNQNPAYRDAKALTAETGADPKVAGAVVELRNSLAQEEAAIQKDQDLTPEQKTVAVMLAREQMEGALRQVLGDEAYAKYQKKFEKERR
ncbi:MAG: hypothetical protein WCO56_05845 [Verrucomicrobiota bacterium]